MVKVTNIKVTSLKPTVKDPAILKLLPTRLHPEQVEFVLDGTNNSVANAIRRTLMSELLVKAMKMEYSDVVTNDPFIIQEMIVSRFQMVPIHQDTPLDAEFELYAENNTTEPRDVKSGEIRISRGKLKELPFNETFTLFALRPGKKCHIKNIKINQSYGFIQGNGMYAISSGAVCLSLDQTPRNPYEGTGISSSVSNPRKYLISFRTNGTAEPAKIMRDVCDNIINRLRMINGMLPSIESSENLHVLKIEGESDTIGNLLMRNILEYHPSVNSVTYTDAVAGRRSTDIRIDYHGDVREIFTTTVYQVVKVFEEIKKYFS